MTLSVLPLRSATRPRGLHLSVACAVVALACSATAGPVRPEAGVGLPADPASGTRSPAASSPADTARIRVVPPLPDTAMRSGEAISTRTVPAPRTRLSAPAQLSRTPIIRVLLGIDRESVPFSGTGRWEVVRPGAATAVANGAPGREWQIERQGRRLRVVRADGAATAFREGVLELRLADSAGLVKYRTRRVRGALTFHATDTGVMVVNALPLEEYLGGVVPREIGTERTWAELSAVEAQAVAARSYALIRRAPAARYDVRATTADQVYGGADAETAVGNRAVSNTTGLVLRYGNRTVSAPYHSTCGGSTAEAQEVWGTRGEPFLQRVSDRVPGTSRDYCEASPRYRWTKSIAAATLDAAVARHLRAFHAVPPGGPGPVRAVRVETIAPSGRVGTASIITATRTYTLRGNDVRSVLRQPGGEILNSAYFAVVGPADAGGGVRLEGRGYGHGVGMCQWGAIGRARAGQGFRAILQAYYPGTTVGPAP